MLKDDLTVLFLDEIYIFWKITSQNWLKMKNADAPAVKREAEEDWGKERWR
jgi:hypothetical protein